MFSIWSLVTGWSNERFEKQTLPDLLEILGNGTVAEKQGNLISNDTLRQVDGKSDEVSGTAWSQQLWVGFQKLFSSTPLSIST